MGFVISAPIVYEEAVITKYRALSFGAVLLEIVIDAGIVILPLIFGLMMGNFWAPYQTFSVIPTMEYDNKALLRLTTTTNEEFLWCSSDGFMDTVLAGDSRYLSPFISVQQDDRDGDGKIDQFTWKVDVSLPTTADSTSGERTVKSFEFLSEYRYAFNSSRFNLFVRTAPLVTAVLPSTTSLNSANTAMSIFISGDLEFSQIHPLFSSSFVRYDRIYNGSYFPDALKDIDSLSAFPSVLAAKYAKRNESVVFRPKVTTWSHDDGPITEPQDLQGNGGIVSTQKNIQFSATISMRVVNADINYVAGVLEMLKYGWVQYFAIGYVVYWFLYHICRIFVKNGLVDTIAFFNARRGTESVFAL